MTANTWIAAADTAISAGTAGLNYYGSKKQNKFAAKQAQKQMDFQERMSSTAYQRAMADMEAAGINPILAYQQGGASSPGGAQAPVQNEMAGAVSSAMDARRTMAELRNLEATNKNLAVANKKMEAETEFTKFLADTQAATAKQTANAVPASENRKEFDESKIGKFTYWADRFLPFIKMFKP